MKGTFQCIIHNILKRAMYVRKSIIKAARQTCRFNSCVVSVYRNNPETMASIKIDDLMSVKSFNPHGEPSGVGR